MPITANNTQITFNDNTRQVTAYPTAAVQNRIMRVYEGPSVTANTTGTWPKPTGLKGIQVTVVGGGNRGGRGTPGVPTPSNFNQAFGGGGAGGTAIRYYPAPSIPGPQPYRAGGAANTSSFGVAPLTVISATAGNTGTAFSGGTGGIGTNGDINIRGGSGGRAANLISGLYNGGVGGMSSLGGGGASGSDGNKYGGGGGGASGCGIPGIPNSFGLGGVGVVIIEEYY
jgi:hypothetical protein